MPDLHTLIPESISKWLAAILTVFVSIAFVAIEGDWFVSDVTLWLGRAVHVIAVLSSIFGWGVIVKKVQK